VRSHIDMRVYNKVLRVLRVLRTDTPLAFWFSALSASVEVLRTSACTRHSLAYAVDLTEAGWEGMTRQPFVLRKEAEGLTPHTFRPSPM